MNQVVAVIALVLVIMAAMYLLALGGFATTRRLHFMELALRVLAGMAFVISAPRLAFGEAISFFWWVLVTTSVGLALVPWKLHQRFALWSVPRATQRRSLIGVGSQAAGIGLIMAVVFPYATV